jgi:hypothetical protein
MIRWKFAEINAFFYMLDYLCLDESEEKGNKIR